MDCSTLLTVIDAASAGGTVAVAVIATWQTKESMKQGKRAKEEFLQTRYDNARPILIITSNPQCIPIQQGNKSYLDWNSPPPTIEVHNIGNGLASNIRSVIYGPEAIAISKTYDMQHGVTWKYWNGKEAEEEREKHWYHRVTHIVDQGERKELQYHLDDMFTLYKFCEKNKHIGLHTFNSPKQPVVASNKEPVYICRVTITYHDIFRRKHASIHNLVYGQRWEVVDLLDNIVDDLDDLVEKEII